jgi:DNA-binding NarL/FixJ family response regulator
VQSFQPDQKAIIVSGFSETDRVREVQRLGAGICLKKPYTFDELAVAVKQELQKGTAPRPTPEGW